MKKNPLVAFILAFIPGAGHLYLDIKTRGTLYFIGFLGPIFLGMFVIIMHRGGLALPLVVLSFFVWLVNMVDMILTLIKKSSSSLRTSEEKGDEQAELHHLSTIFLSFIPGLGHFQLGLMNRGLTFLVAFFGLITMIFFVAFISHQDGFLIFVGLLPIIWIYSFFDTFQQLNRKQKGEVLVDQTILEDFEHYHQNGKKSKPLAILLSIFPGAGHMYLGLQRRGIQLMAAFLFSIYILDVLRLSAFLFLIPLIWFYSFFDALQKVSKQDEEELEDVPVISYFINHQKWVGIILVTLGLYYIVDNIFIPIIGPRILKAFNINIIYWYHRFFQTAVVCLLLIGGGIKLLSGNKKSERNVKS